MKGNFIIKRASFINAPKEKIEVTDMLFSRDSLGVCKVSLSKNEKKTLRDGTTIVDGDGIYVAPAFCDVRCNVGDVFRRGGAPDISSADYGGYGVICPTPTWDSAEYPETPAMFEKYNKKLKSYGGIKILPAVPIVKKHLSASPSDIYGIAEKGGSIFTDATPTGYLDNSTLRQIMIKVANVNGLLILTSHDKKIALDGTVNKGRAETLTSQKGIPHSAELLSVMRNIILAEETGCRIHIAGISLGRSVEMIRNAKKRGVAITCSVAPPYFSYTEEELIFRGAMAKLLPPLRSSDDLSAVISGLADGTIDCIETDHVPVSASAKKDLTTGAFGSTGFETAFGAGITNLVKTGHITLFRLIELMSIKPYEILFGKKFEISDLAVTGVVKLDLTGGGIYSKQRSLLAGRVSVFDGAYLYGDAKKISF